MHTRLSELTAREEGSAIKIRIGVMGSAGGDISAQSLAKARQLGEEIARHECILITGACPGLPHEAAVGARSLGGLLIGISPALSLDEHVGRYHSPYEEYDAIIFTGSGLMGREIEAIRSCDIVTIVGGRSGTLGEFCIAYDEGKLIAVLKGTGGVADHIDEVVSIVNKTTRSQVVYDEDPLRLVEKAIEAHNRRVEQGIAFLPPPANG